MQGRNVVGGVSVEGGSERASLWLWLPKGFSSQLEQGHHLSVQGHL